MVLPPPAFLGLPPITLSLPILKALSISWVDNLPAGSAFIADFNAFENLSAKASLLVAMSIPPPPLVASLLTIIFFGFITIGIIHSPSISYQMLLQDLDKFHVSLRCVYTGSV